MKRFKPTSFSSFFLSFKWILWLGDALISYLNSLMNSSCNIQAISGFILRQYMILGHFFSIDMYICISLYIYTHFVVCSLLQVILFLATTNIKRKGVRHSPALYSLLLKHKVDEIMLSFFHLCHTQSNF